ncbi:hypothetical protein PMAYCL1PPCAC_11799 [Pristionchus mayeri]|uniref:Uncharacterized protein n=1 Tax=Pristionchus mayeri TaxID=1317129 RepID=A0AAN4ZKK8_9BILA|nr:hypothetical protein PMAYCL1PPCAC_11799 [Pristionchus mayeri]
MIKVFPQWSSYFRCVRLMPEGRECVRSFSFQASSTNRSMDPPSANEIPTMRNASRVIDMATHPTALLTLRLLSSFTSTNSASLISITSFWCCGRATRIEGRGEVVEWIGDSCRREWGWGTQETESDEGRRRLCEGKGRSRGGGEERRRRICSVNRDRVRPEAIGIE